MIERKSLQVPVEIARVREEHVKGFHAALDAVARERAFLTFLEAPPIELSRNFIGKSLANGYPHFVALAGDCVIGWCDVTPKADRPATRHTGVLGMGILQAWRGRGIGERLIRQAIEASRAFGLSRVELEVRDDNALAMALYRKVGFGVEGRRRRALLIDGVYYDLIGMALLFDAPR